MRQADCENFLNFAKYFEGVSFVIEADYPSLNKLHICAMVGAIFVRERDTRVAERESNSCGRSIGASGIALPKLVFHRENLNDRRQKPAIGPIVELKCL
ncbi:hypothetical protein [Rhizobium sp. HT1-10]|uniref:hypothetical protein n=1 Tax=Rhizobium sp. HT1-10 TaxID=3111638 RepID=UPI003C22F30E